MAIRATLAGIPRIGRNHEFKRTLENYQRDPAADGLLAATAHNTVDSHTGAALKAGIGSAPTIGHSSYDLMLDTSALFGVLSARFQDVPKTDGSNLPEWINHYFATARGTKTQPTFAMTKWFDANYHYIVPELPTDTESISDLTDWLDDSCSLNNDAITMLRPHLIGSVTYLSLSRTDGGSNPLDLPEQLTDTYSEVIAQLGERGFKWVQLDEPVLVTDLDEMTLARTSQAYGKLANMAESANTKLWVQTYLDDGGQALETLSGTNVQAIGCDLVAGNFELPHWTGKELLVADIVDGCNARRIDLDVALATLEKLAARGPITVLTSCSLLCVPYSLTAEDLSKEDAEVLQWLAFGDEKIVEVALLVRAFDTKLNDRQLDAKDLKTLRGSRITLASRAESNRIAKPEVHETLEVIGESDRTRSLFTFRRVAQAKAISLPPLPTTIIGSLPQTKRIRYAHAQLCAGELTPADYDSAMLAETRCAIEQQEELGLDVLVHSEAERNDMV